MTEIQVTDTTSIYSYEKMIPDTIEPDSDIRSDKMDISKLKEKSYQYFYGVNGLDGLFGDKRGEFIKKIKYLVANPPPGTRNDAIVSLGTSPPTKKYENFLKSMIAKGVGYSTEGFIKDDNFEANSFPHVHLPEDAFHLQYRGDATFHHYDVLTYLGKVDNKKGITADLVRIEGLENRYSFPGKGVKPTAANFNGPSQVYAVDPEIIIPLHSLNKKSADRAVLSAENYTYPVGFIEQAKVPGGVINITTVDHDVYRGTIRRTIVEYSGHLFVHTHGAGINRFRNHTPYTPYWNPFIKDSVQIIAAKANDIYGAKAFQALDQELVKFINNKR